MGSFHKDNNQLYSKEEADICLDCTNKRCVGECDRLRQEKRKIREEQKKKAAKKRKTVVIRLEILDFEAKILLKAVKAYGTSSKVPRSKNVCADITRILEYQINEGKED